MSARCEVGRHKSSLANNWLDHSSRERCFVIVPDITVVGKSSSTFPVSASADNSTHVSDNYCEESGANDSGWQNGQREIQVDDGRVVAFAVSAVNAAGSLSVVDASVGNDQTSSWVNDSHAAAQSVNGSNGLAGNDQKAGLIRQWEINWNGGVGTDNLAEAASCRGSNGVAQDVVRSQGTVCVEVGASSAVVVHIVKGLGARRRAGVRQAQYALSATVGREKRKQQRVGASSAHSSEHHCADRCSDQRFLKRFLHDYNSYFGQNKTIHTYRGDVNRQK